MMITTASTMADPIRYRVLHETLTTYHRTVTLSQQFLHMTPRSFLYQQTQSHQLTIDPKPPDWSNRIDYFGNATRSLTLPSPHRELLVLADTVVLLTPRPRMTQLANSLSWEEQRACLLTTQDATSLEPYVFLYESPHISCGEELVEYASSSFTPGRALLDACMELTERIYHDFKYDPEATTISTPLIDVLRGRRGVCQDFAHLMIGCLRSLGLACRYISGYILTTPPAGQPRLVGADASHAWVSVYCEGYGWVDFDPTNRCLVKDEHITVGWGRDFSDVTPMRGIVLGGGGQELRVAVTVALMEN
ncbi:transglutaminase family protein [Actimicrobium antarcticum]|uniref:Transglutaminase family protein n=1 Tax=Actimicrobium antarcticum TaxID=1051899 RepID=A0ABP7TNE6_9BURK